MGLIKVGNIQWNVSYVRNSPATIKLIRPRLAPETKLLPCITTASLLIYEGDHVNNTDCELHFSLCFIMLLHCISVC